MVKNLPAKVGDIRDVGSIPEPRGTPWRRAWQPTPILLPGESLWIEEPGGLHTVRRVTKSQIRNVRCESNSANFRLQFEHVGAALQRRTTRAAYLVRSVCCFSLSVSVERLQGNDCGFDHHLSTSTCCTSERGLNFAQSFSWRVIGNCG